MVSDLLLFSAARIFFGLYKYCLKKKRENEASVDVTFREFFYFTIHLVTQLKFHP